MLTVFSSMLCPDCRECVRNFDAHGIEYRIIDINENMPNLKAFLRLRDGSPVFGPCREKGSVGIPAIVFDDGAVTLDWESVLSERGLPIVYREERPFKVINFFDSGDKEHWIAEIKRSDWRAGAFLAGLLENGGFFDAVGEGSRVLLLTNGEELISYCTYSKMDDIQPTELTPWVGFVYTFPAHRGHRFAGLLFEEVCRLAETEGAERVYLSTNHIGLYEKYGFEFYGMMDDIDGAPSRVYYKKIG